MNVKENRDFTVTKKFLSLSSLTDTALQNLDPRVISPPTVRFRRAVSINECKRKLDFFCYSKIPFSELIGGHNSSESLP